MYKAKRKEFALSTTIVLFNNIVVLLTFMPQRFEHHSLVIYNCQSDLNGLDQAHMRHTSRWA